MDIIRFSGIPVLIFSLSTSFAQFDVRNLIAEEVATEQVKTQGQQTFYPFKIGGREQRVRFFLLQPEEAMYSDPNYESIRDDILRRNDPNPISIFGTKVLDPSRIREFSHFAPEDSPEKEGRGYGLAVNAHLMLCASSQLAQVKRVSARLHNIYHRLGIDEINIFLFTADIHSVDRNELRITYSGTSYSQRRLRDSVALNILTPIRVPSGECGLDTDENLRTALFSFL